MVLHVSSEHLPTSGDGIRMMTIDDMIHPDIPIYITTPAMNWQIGHPSIQTCGLRPWHSEGRSVHTHEKWSMTNWGHTNIMLSYFIHFARRSEHDDAEMFSPIPNSEISVIYHHLPRRNEHPHSSPKLVPLCVATHGATKCTSRAT